MPGGRRAGHGIPGRCHVAGADDALRAAPESVRRLLRLPGASPDDRGDGRCAVGADARRNEGEAARRLQRVEAGVRAYKFLTAEGLGVFSGFAWPLPSGEPGAWVEAEVETCRSGVHACRTGDLPYWTAPALYELQLDGPVDEQAVKVVALRGRLLRHVEAWNADTREAYGQMCFARAHELVAKSNGRLDSWAPMSGISFSESARLGFIAATIAEQLAGFDAHLEERRRQSEWLVENLALH